VGEGDGEGFFRSRLICSDFREVFWYPDWALCGSGGASSQVPEVFKILPELPVSLQAEITTSLPLFF